MEKLTELTKEECLEINGGLVWEMITLACAVWGAAYQFGKDAAERERRYWNCP